MDEDETYEMMQSFNPESIIERNLFAKKFKEFDEDDDGSFDNNEMAEFWISLIGYQIIKNKDQLKTVVNKRVSKTM